MERSNVDDLLLLIDGKEISLSALGVLYYEGAVYIVLNDVPALAIDKDEYEIFELFLNEKGNPVSIAQIADTHFYFSLCEMWEIRMQEDLEDDS